MNNQIECNMCGTCCIAYSISALNKKAGEPCVHLLPNGKCNDYKNRPQVCIDFKPDNLCHFLSSLPQDEQVDIIMEMYNA